MVNISLEEMFNELVDCAINRKEVKAYYYKRENMYTGNPEYVEISEVDLLRGRFITLGGDFSEFEWELKESHIYREE